LFTIVLASAAPEGRLFGLDGQTIIQVVAQLINVGFLAFVLSKLLYKPVGEFMAKRSERIRGQLEHAEDESAKAQELRSLYEQKLQEIGRERDAILDKAHRQALENGRQLLAEAKAEADGVKSRAQSSVKMEWERAQAEMKLAILEISAAMAEKMVTLSVDKDAHERLFSETMAELEGVSWRS